MSGLDQSLKLRAQEIAAAEGSITIREAVKRALEERFDGDFDALVEIAATLGAGSLSNLRQRTYDLPEEQDVLPFDIPDVIGVRTPDGDMLVRRDDAQRGQVRQWQREAHQHHSAQAYRFKRFGEQLALVDDEADDLEWAKAREIIADRRREIGRGAAE